MRHQLYPGSSKIGMHYIQDSRRDTSQIKIHDMNYYYDGKCFMQTCGVVYIGAAKGPKDPPENLLSEDT
eukprot:6187794-Pleurochrysis_carterae.AAC.1